MARVGAGMRHPGGVRRGVGTGLWVLFVTVAVGSGWIAVQMVGAAIAPASAPALSAGEVSQRLATSTPAPETAASDRPSAKKTRGPEPTSSGSPGQNTAPSATPDTADTVVRTLVSRAGSVVAECTGTRVYLRSASPAVGYDFDEWDRGPAEEAEVRFTGESREVKMQVTCRADGVPTATVEGETESDDDG